MALLLLFSTFVVATCGLIYELIGGTLASYLLGDSVTQFSTVIGTYLFAMGVGSYLSRFVQKRLIETFVQVELLVGAIGGTSAAVLFLLFDYVAYFRLLLYGTVFLIGMFVGLEIPLLMRILEPRLKFKDLVSQVLSFDYVGALAASVLFPLLFVPNLGLVRTAFFFGILNILVALWVIVFLGKELRSGGRLKISAVVILAILGSGFVFADSILELSESGLYPDKIIYAKTSPYQRIVLTRSPESIKLYLGGHLQFDSRDEYRYHEALVHVGLQSLPQARKILVLGGGDGFAVREILRYPNIESVVLVDLDPAMTSMFTRNDLLAGLNGQALRSDKVRVINQDAFSWIKESSDVFDFIVIDFPDPTNFSLGKLYSTRFYQLLKRVLRDDGYLVVQSTSPLLAPKSFWCVEKTLREVGLHTLPYHAFVPSFGEWGFILAGKSGVVLADNFMPNLKFVTSQTLPALLNFPLDMQQRVVQANRLNNQALVHYYEEEWARYSS